ncbi:MAG: hypothetical protein ABI647_04425 [Gemmatimonadota bacterium]
MRLRSTPLVTFVLTVMAAAPLAAQLRASRPARPVQNNPRLMVANPHSFAPTDSAAAVRVGSGMRDRIEGIAEKWYTTITRAQMNEALLQYGYPPDAVLPPLVARQLASQLQGRALVTSTLTRGEGGRVTVESRLAGISDQTGHMVRGTQAANQSFEEFGAKLADSLKFAFNALPDAKQCEQFRSTDTKKATEAAGKALKEQPNDGLAEWCLANILATAKGPRPEIITHLKNATKGDPLSLEAWTLLANQYEANNDTVPMIETYQRMLQVAPTNQKLREEIFKRFIGLGRPEAGEAVAREGLKLDPTNADLWDLLSSACLVQEKPEKYPCAIEALEQVYAIDSTKADTLFYTKMTFAASRQPDTLRMLKWAVAGSQKYPNNGILLGQLVQAYGFAGPIDSLVGATKRLMQKDTTDVGPVLRAVRSLAAAKRGQEALDLAPYIEKYGDAEAKQNMSLILSREAALPLLQTQEYALAADISRKALALAPENSQASNLANYVLGLAVFLQIPPLDKQTEAGKSCDMAKQEQTMLDEATKALTAGRSIAAETIDKYLQGAVAYAPRVASMIKAYCK